MAFTNFTRQGHRELMDAMLAALKPLEQQLGVTFEAAGGKIGSTDLTMNIRAKPVDTAVVEDAAKLMFGYECRLYGLEPSDYGAIFVSQSKRYKLVGVKTSRPKYPLSAECLSTGRTFKFSTSAVRQIVAARAANQAAPASTATPPFAVAPVQSAAPSLNTDAYSGLAQF